MIGKIGRGQSFLGLADYLLAAEDHAGDTRVEAEIIGGTVIPHPGSNRPARDLARKYGAFREMRPYYKNCVCHQIFRLADADVDRVNNTMKAEIAAKWCQRMGYEAFTTISHGQDWHVEASRINPDGSVVPDSHEIRRSERIMHDLRTEYGLTSVAPSHNIDPGAAANHKKAPTMAQLAMAKRGRNPPSKVVAGVIDNWLENGGGTAPEFCAHMAAHKIDVRPNLAASGKLNGFSYLYDGIDITAKAMGRSDTLANLTSRGLEYEQSRDIEGLRAVRDHSVRTIAGLDEGNRTGVGGYDCATGGVASTPGRANGQGTAADSPQHGHTDRGERWGGEPECEGAEQNSDGYNCSRAGFGPGGQNAGPLIRIGSKAALQPSALDMGVGVGGGSVRRLADLAGIEVPVAADANGGPAAANHHGAADRGEVPGPELVLNGPLHDGVAIDRTMAAVQAAVRAMPSPCYVVGIHDQVSGKMMTRKWTPQHLGEAGRIKWLKRQNAKGSNIYFRPGGEERHSWVLVDDLTVERVDKLRSDGFEPCLVAETSAGNHQAWVRFPAGVTDEERLALGQTLAETVGGDAASVGRDHFGRLPGFTNQKPTRQLENDFQPWVFVRAAVNRLASKGQDLLERVREVFWQRQVETTRFDAGETIFARPDQWLAGSIDTEWKATMQRILAFDEKKGAKADYSALEFRAVQTMLAAGWPESDLFSVVAAGGTRKRNPDDYAKRTVAAAAASDYVQQRWARAELDETRLRQRMSPADKYGERQDVAPMTRIELQVGSGALKGEGAAEDREWTEENAEINDDIASLEKEKRRRDLDISWP